MKVIFVPSPAGERGRPEVISGVIEEVNTLDDLTEARRSHDDWEMFIRVGDISNVLLLHEIRDNNPTFNMKTRRRSK